MLKTLDVLIGLSVIMLMLSLVVTTITQALLYLRQSRGKQLLSGLVDLLKQLDPALEQHAQELANQILAHPLIRESEKRLGTVVRRDEFTRILLDLATRPEAAVAGTAENALLGALRNHNVADPAGTLANIRTLAVQLERSDPELSTSLRQSLAILHATASELLGKVNSWFDHTMDRVAERFTADARFWTVLAALLVVAFTQVDTIDVVNRLAMDDAMRQGLVREAVKIVEREQQQSAPGGTAQPQRAPQGTEEYYRVLSESGVLHVPSLRQWVENWSKLNPAGLLVPVLLLSLGAPFWYKALSSLVRLRSTLAAKDDAERTERDTLTPLATAPPGASAPGGGAPALPAALAGERGDLAAVG